MKKLLSTIFILSLLTPLLKSQTLTGKVNDEQGQSIEFATVALFGLPDTTLISGTITDENGEYLLSSDDNGDKFLRISFIGYKTQNVPAKPHQTIVLKNEDVILGEVVVKGSLPKISLQNDAIVATVQNTVLSKAGTANDVLKRLPSLTGDEGVFSVFGKGQAVIFINNREMRDVSELDNLNSADIKNVEIVMNPGSRYDATVKAVIRINTVRRVGDGFGFDVRSSYYQSENTDLIEQVNLNYRRNGWDVFGTFKYHQNVYEQNSEIWQKTYVDTLWTQENTFVIDGDYRKLTGIAGVNYEITPEHFAGIKYTYSAFPRKESMSVLNSTVVANGSFYDQWSSSEKKTSSSDPTQWINAYYNGRFGDLKIDFNTDFYTNTTFAQSLVKETSQEYDDRIVNSENDVKNQLIASKVVASYPVLGGQFLIGSEYHKTHRDDVYRNEQNIVPPSNTTIEEQNNSYFTEFSRATPIGQIGAGLRYENIRSDYYDENQKVDEQSRHYGQWFPNFSLSTSIKEVNLHVSYTAKTMRPTYRQLSSNVFYGNRFLLQTGNPFLKSTVIHDVTLVSSWKFMQLMVSYKNEKDAIIYWTEQLEENPAVSLLAYRNLDELPSLMIFLSLTPTFGIWSPQLSGGFLKQWVTIISNNQPVILNDALPFATLNNSFRLPKDFLVTVDASFRGKGDTQNVSLPENQFVVNVGVTKSFIRDQLRVEVKGQDVFYGKKDANLLYNHQMELFQRNRYDSRQIMLTVRYKFNQAKSKYKGTGAGEDEIDRLK